MLKKSPVTNGTRHQLNISLNLLSKKTDLIKKIIKGYSMSFGRSKGRITVRHKGGLRKNRLRIISYPLGTNMKLCTFYDPMRNAFLDLNFNYEKKVFCQNLAIEHTYPGSWIVNSNNMRLFRVGYRSYLKNIYPGALISNIGDVELNKAKYLRSAGSYGQILKISKTLTKIKLASSKIVDLNSLHTANLGAVSNKKAKLVTIGKAGRNRHKGKRPSVRGVAMNPVDHPHGGRTNGGRSSVSPWGLPTKCGFKLKRKI